MLGAKSPDEGGWCGAGQRADIDLALSDGTAKGVCRIVSLCVQKIQSLIDRLLRSEDFCELPAPSRVF
jgi:hypothetical protein